MQHGCTVWKAFSDPSSRVEILFTVNAADHISDSSLRFKNCNIWPLVYFTE